MGKLSFLNISDAYERKARFLPGLLSLLPALPALIAYTGQVDSWVRALIAGVGVSAAIAVLISHVAAAMGHRFERALWPNSPHDLPTNRWLSASDTTASSQQKKLWVSQIRKITGIDLSKAEKQSIEEARTAVHDAVRNIRNQLWGNPIGKRVAMHNADYGFARNLCGLRALWVTLATMSAIACWAGVAILEHPLNAAVLSTVVLVFAGFLALLLPSHVKRKAEHYADSFFSTLPKLVEEKKKRKTMDSNVVGCDEVTRLSDVPLSEGQQKRRLD